METETKKPLFFTLDEVSTAVQSLLVPKEAYRVALNRSGRTDDAHINLFMTREHGLWRFAFEDAYKQVDTRIERCVELRLGYGVQIPFLLRFMIRDKKIVWVRKSWLQDQMTGFEQANSVPSISEINPLKTIEFYLQYFEARCLQNVA